MENILDNIDKINEIFAKMLLDGDSRYSTLDAYLGGFTFIDTVNKLDDKDGVITEIKKYFSKYFADIKNLSADELTLVEDYLASFIDREDFDTAYNEVMLGELLK